MNAPCLVNAPILLSVEAPAPGAFDQPSLRDAIMPNHLRLPHPKLSYAKTISGLEHQQDLCTFQVTPMQTARFEKIE